MFHVFGSNHSEVGLLDLNLILNTAGKIKIRYGNKFIDLLDDKGNINAPFPKIVVKISSEDLMKSNCFYLLDDILYLKYQDLVIEVSNQKVGYLEYTNPQELTEELIKTVQNNIGLTYDSTSNIPIKDGIIFVGSKIYKVDSGNLSEYLKEPLESINKLEKLPNLDNSVIAWNKSSWTYVPMITIEEYNEFKTSISLKFLELAKNNDTPIYPFDSVLYSDKVYTVTEFMPDLSNPIYTTDRLGNRSIEKYLCSGAHIYSVPTLNILYGTIIIMTVSGNKGITSTNEKGKLRISITDTIISYVFNLMYIGNGNFIFLDNNNNSISYYIYPEKYNKKEYYIFNLPGNIYIYFKKEGMFIDNNLFIKLDVNVPEKFRIDYGNSQIGIEENYLNEYNEIKITPHVVLGDLDDSNGFYNNPPIPFRTYSEKSYKLGLYSDQAVFNGAEFRGKWPKEFKEYETEEEEEEELLQVLDYPRYSKKLSKKLEKKLKPTDVNDNNRQIIPDINWIMKYIQVPKGVIVMWSGNSESVPDGWVICNGENGTPDLRDKFIVGAGSEDYPVGSTGGEKEITLTIELIPAHDHTLDLSGKVLSGSGEWNFYYGDENVYLSTNLSSVTTSSVGEGEAHENRPPYYALYYIMKIK